MAGGSALCLKHKEKSTKNNGRQKVAASGLVVTS
jgi:hypothetical protein